MFIYLLNMLFSSIILPPGQLDSLVEDAAEFLKSEDWYISSGIPNRRGYLLHGPPGTGKSEATPLSLHRVLHLTISPTSIHYLRPRWRPRSRDLFALPGIEYVRAIFSLEETY
jgi:hypothetical protein